VGCGDVGLRRHVPAVVRSPAFELAAVVDPRDDARAQAARWSRAPAYATLGEALAVRPDAAIVATPPEVTPAMTREAIAHGLPVLCEKPMAVDLATARAVHVAAVASGVPVQVGFTNRFSPLVQELRHRLEVSALGTPLAFTLGAYDERYDPEDRTHLDRIAHFLEHGPAFVHEGAHLADYVRYLTGARPRRVAAVGLRSRAEFASENFTAAVVEYDSGDVARLEVGWLLGALPRGQFRVLGPSGMAEIDRAQRRLTLELPSGTDVRELAKDWDEASFTGQLESFGAALRGEIELSPSTADGVASLELSDAIVGAMRSGRTVELSDAPAATAPSGS